MNRMVANTIDMIYNQSQQDNAHSHAAKLTKIWLQDEGIHTID